MFQEVIREMALPTRVLAATRISGSLEPLDVRESELRDGHLSHPELLNLSSDSHRELVSKRT